MTRERTIRGQVAVAGVGETTYYKHGQSPDSEFALALQAILARLRGRGHRPAPGRRLRVLQQRPQRSLAPRRGARPARAALLQHAVGRRRRRRLGGGGQRRRRGRGGLRRLRRRLPRARPGPVPALRRRARRAATVAGEAGAHVPVRAHVAGPALRDAGDALHARARRPPRGAAGDRAGVVPPRAGEPARGHARPAADRGDVRRLALDRRAVPALRLLPGERRRRRARPRLRRARRATCASRPPTSSAPRRARSTATPRRGHNAPIYATLELHHGGAAPLRDGRAWGRRTSTSCRATRTSPAAC